jgi:hypothetical protein
VGGIATAAGMLVSDSPTRMSDGVSYHITLVEWDHHQFGSVMGKED